MFSYKSLKKFILINSTIVGLAACKWYFSESIIGTVVSEVCTSIALLNFLNVNKPAIHDSKRQQPVEQFRGEFVMYTVMISSIKAMTHWMILDGLNSDMYSILLFLPRSLAFELVFDLCHYTAHRFAHSNRHMYRFHKVHHKFIHPCAQTTFYMHPVDCIVSYAIPVTIATTVIGIQDWEFYLLTVYLTYQEIAGHLGKKMYPTSCFSQCIWLPRALGIELYTEDHDLHHTKFNYNYAKRFSVWDKLFGTFQSGIVEM